MKPIVFLILLISLLSATSATASSTETTSFHVSVTGNGPAVILIPGLNSSSEVWNSSVTLFSQHKQIHTLHLAGFAGLELKGDPSLSRVKQDIINYVKTKKLNNPSIIGHSLGGFLALSLAIEEPKLFGKLVIIDALPFWPLVFNPMATPASMLEQATALKKQIEVNTNEVALRQYYSSTLASMINDPLWQKKATEWSLKSDTRMTAQSLFELQTTDLRDQLDKIQAPALILGSWSTAKHFGGTKQSVADHMDMQYTELANKRIIIHDNAKHFIMLDAPEWTAKLIRDFL
ncbi:MAG: N-formylmaleamate deformylase [Flavobacteriales bacterium]|jgi:N-formylmaleamate deformylase